MTAPQYPPVRLRPEIVSLPAYRQGKPASAEAFKLSSNENPFDPLPSVLHEVQNLHSFNRYPDATAAGLRTALAERFGVTPDEVHVGAGSVSLLAQFISAAASTGDEVVYAWRSFEAYPGLVTTAGATSIRVPLRDDLGHDLEAMAAAVTERTRVVIVCTPNNPTSTVVTADEFTAFLAAIPSDVLVLLDEAYAEFVTDTDAVRGTDVLTAERPESVGAAAGETPWRHPNVVVLRTFSKAYGLAGLRVGYAIGPKAILDAARSTAIPLSVTEYAQVAATASLEHEGELLDRVGRIVRLRDQLWQALVDQGWNVAKPQGNFVWLPTGAETADAAAVFDDSGVVARAFPPEGIRVSIGEAQSADALLNATALIIRSLPQGHAAKRLG